MVSITNTTCIMKQEDCVNFLAILLTPVLIFIFGIFYISGKDKPNLDG